MMLPVLIVMRSISCWAGVSWQQETYEEMSPHQAKATVAMLGGALQGMCVLWPAEHMFLTLSALHTICTC